MRRKLIFASTVAAIMLAAPLSLYTFAQPGKDAEGKAQAANSQSAAQAQDEGQKIFQRNCSRCHNAPEGFSPRISGTIVRHMRVRAGLSQHDEQELLKFFNP